MSHKTYSYNNNASIIPPLPTLNPRREHPTPPIPRRRTPSSGHQPREHLIPVSGPSSEYKDTMPRLRDSTRPTGPEPSSSAVARGRDDAHGDFGPEELVEEEGEVKADVSELHWRERDS